MAVFVFDVGIEVFVFLFFGSMYGSCDFVFFISVMWLNGMRMFDLIFVFLGYNFNIWVYFCIIDGVG